MSLLCCAVLQCNRPEKHENKTFHLQSHLIDPKDILIRDFLYEGKPYQCPTKSKLLFNFIENLSRNEELQNSLPELKRLRNKKL